MNNSIDYIIKKKIYEYWLFCGLNYDWRRVLTARIMN